MWTEDQLDAVWNKAKKMPGKDPEKYRHDPYGNVMYRPSYGKNSPMGWVIGHIKPESRGGTDSLRNLQALNTKVNVAKRDSLVKKSRHSKGNK
ncbi:MAG: HNH endonuclease [Bacillota bacterium]|nr:HNH endonuclease [Bacillota bacterium]